MNKKEPIEGTQWGPKLNKELGGEVGTSFNNAISSPSQKEILPVMPPLFSFHLFAFGKLKLLPPNFIKMQLIFLPFAAERGESLGMSFTFLLLILPLSVIPKNNGDGDILQ
jgi:hypothetical protein